MNIRATSPDHLYINDLLLDLNQVWDWYNHKTWPSHSPRQALVTLHKIVGQIYRGEYDLTQTNLVEWLLDRIQTVQFYGYYTEDQYYWDAPHPFRRYKQGEGRNGKENRVIHWYERTGAFAHYEADYPTYEIRRPK